MSQRENRAGAYARPASRRNGRDALGASGASGRSATRRTSAAQTISYDELRARSQRRTPARADERGGARIEEEEACSARPSRLAQMKKRRAKEKAGRAFRRQFGESGSSASSSGAPRAALYKGEMGRRHRQASRMQNGPSTSRAKTGRGGAPASASRHPRLAAALVALGCFALACVLVYPAAQQYYVTLREHDQLQAEYDALEQRNAAIESEVNALTTDEGIEDRAREEFGWVKEGEQTATVVGLESDGVQESAYKEPVVPGSIEAPETWYSPLLDAVFGVS